MNAMKTSLAVCTLLLAALWVSTTAGAATEVATFSNSKPPCWFCFQELQRCIRLMRQYYRRFVELATLVSAEFVTVTVPDVLPSTHSLIQIAVLVLCLVVIPAYLGKQLLQRHLLHQQIQDLAAINQQRADTIQQQIEQLTAGIEAQKRQVEHLIAEDEALQRQIERVTAETEAQKQQIDAKQQQIWRVIAETEAQKRQVERFTAEIEAQKRQIDAKRQQIWRLTADKHARQQQTEHLKTTAGIIKDTIKPGDGVNFPQKGQRVTVHFTLTLSDGTKMCSTHDSRPLSFKAGANQVVKILDEGILLMSLGQRALLACSPQYAPYGDTPPNASMKYDVELISIA